MSVLLQHLVLMETDETTNHPVCRRLVLEFSDEEKTSAVVEVNRKLVQHLKPHQAEGRVKVKLTQNGNLRPASPLQERTCHMGLHNVTCPPTEVTFLPLCQPIKSGTSFSNPKPALTWLADYTSRCCTCPKTVVHPSPNRA